jgi:hypothetical protein
MVCTHGGWFQGFQSAGCELAASHAGQRVDPRYSLLLFRASFEHVESAESKTTFVSITVMVLGPYVALTSAKRLYMVYKGMAAGTHSKMGHRRG